MHRGPVCNELDETDDRYAVVRPTARVAGVRASSAAYNQLREASPLGYSKEFFVRDVRELTLFRSFLVGAISHDGETEVQVLEKPSPSFAPSLHSHTSGDQTL